MNLILDERHAQLVAAFTKQQAFSSEYSPLYFSLFGAIAIWLTDEPSGSISTWLLEISRDRQSLEVTLLIAAGLHHQVLLGNPDVSELAAYYPSVGGERPARFREGESWRIAPHFQRILRRTINAHRGFLRQFIQVNTVQTNETGRGISWLLPAYLSGWSRVHLLDLGSSAGLNLVAERRNYTFLDRQNGHIVGRLGYGEPTQFEIRSDPAIGVLIGDGRLIPEILSRTGVDINPFTLNGPLDETTLAAFVWADQPTRLQRLREGIVAFQQVNKGEAPVKQYAVDIPHELPRFLEQYISDDGEPVLCYNTYIRMYLSDKGHALHRYLAGWASHQNRPILWTQWEPPKQVDKAIGRAPEFGWLAWTIDMWYRGEYYHWHIGWVHPHGHQVRCLPGLSEWFRTMRL